MFKKYSLLVTAALIYAATCPAQVKPADNFILLNGNTLAAYKQQYKAGDDCITKQVKALLKQADTLLKAENCSITFKKEKLPPTGNKHDYMSLAPYWWPDTTKADGKPYIRRDGRINPEKYLLHDRDQIGRIEDEVRKLGAAYYFTGTEAYAQKAVTMLKVFFLDADTKMNPNLNYAQYIPGINDGRGIGIIETAGLINIPDAMAFLQGSKSLNADVNNGIKKWFKDYLTWLQTNKNGVAESKEKNNHGTIYDLQVIDFAMYLGDDALAKSILQKQTTPRMEVQFTADGKQPLELARTKSWGYSNMNLLAWCRLAVLAKKQNIDLWQYQTKSGKGIQKCINWLMPFALKQQEWTYEQIEKIGYNDFNAIVDLSKDQYKFTGDMVKQCPGLLH
ncbi:alginate lyase family protein [Mucilaginibacter sp.]|jgi:hypothetical protein|uniref:alginate lyase family protein n=1 Tax=Mucilaginibacter sp. TaxID=1882438 RepID=UPI0035683292